MAKINLNRLKEEIDVRKQGRNISPSGNGKARDSFLNGLVESIRTGQETQSSALVKSVDNKVAEKKGELRKLPINEIVNQQSNNQQYNQQPVHQQRINEFDMSPDRDDLMFADLEKKRRQTLYESMQGFLEPNQNQPINQPNYNPQRNSGIINENVKNMVNDYLVEHLGFIMEESIKETMLELYAVDRIKKVLNENKDIIKGHVIEVIREIQAKSKK